MAVKPQPGETLVEERRTRVETPEEKTKDPSLPTAGQFLDWIAVQPVTEWNRRELAVRLYRGTSTKGSFCEKLFSPPFTLEWVKEKYGGGDYYYMGFEGPTLRWNGTFHILGAPKSEAEIVSAAAVPAGSSETSQLVREMMQMLREEIRAARGGQAMNDAVQQAVQLNGQVFGSAVPAVMAAMQSAGAAQPQNSSNPLMDKVLDILVARAFNPADPIEQFSKMMTAMKAIMPEAGSGGGSGESLAQTFVRVLPSVLERVHGGLQTMAQLREQELRMAMAGARPALPAAPAQAGPHLVETQPAASQPPPPTPQTNPQPAEAGAGPGLLEFIEGGIVRILQRNLPLDDAAHEALVFIDVYASNIIDELCTNPNAEETLLELFRTRPVLTQIPQDPRLSEFVKKFIAAARESRTPASSVEQQPSPPPGPFANETQPGA